MPKKQRVLITDETSVMTRASQREMPRTGKSKPLIHALQLVNSKPKKENAADDRKNIHLTEGSPEVLTATRGLNLGAQQVVPADQH